MWKYSSRENFFLNFDLKSQKFWFTNLNDLYVEENITKDLIEMRFKELNPRIDYEEEIVIENLTEIPTSCKVFKENNMFKLEFKYSIDSDLFKFSWNLKPANSEIKEVLMHPMLLALSSLRKQNTELMDIIKQKDNEIEQYKIEGAVLKRRLIATKKFNKPEFLSKFVQINLSEFGNYTDSNIDTLKDSCKNFIEEIKYDGSAVNCSDNNSLVNTFLLSKNFEKSRKKRALENRRRQNLEKIKKLGQDLTYEENDDVDSSD